MSTDTPTPPRSILCLGEALVELICERSVDGLGDADAFVPHFGGAVANVALLAARAGARTALAGGVGADDWGRWLAETLHETGVDTFHFRLIHGVQTPLALITVGEDGEPAYSRYAESPGTVVEALGADVRQAVADHGALFISSSTLVSAPEREVTMAAREAALELQRPIIFDPQLRLERWRTRADFAASVNACLPGVLLVCATAEEAQMMTGEEDIERAAMTLVKTGAQNVVISLGDEGAILRGKIRLDAPGVVPAHLASRIGAGEALTATLIARLALSGFYEPMIAAALKDGVRASAEACERWGAVD